jgi:hypothetical protein
LITIFSIRLLFASLGFPAFMEKAENRKAPSYLSGFDSRFGWFPAVAENPKPKTGFYWSSLN